MKIAITGATGFMGRHVSRALAAEGHSLVLISRGENRGAEDARRLPGAVFLPAGLDDSSALSDAFKGCEVVIHLAGINRELGRQTYSRVHVEGTRNVVHAAQDAGVRKLLFTSFLRARPGCGSPYHESKFAAEELIRESGLDYTILKPGVTYGRGDHMLDHLRLSLETFPVFPLVGFRDFPVRPLAIADLVRIIAAAATENRLSRETVAVTGPEEITLGEAVRRVARVLGRHPLIVRAPVWGHVALAWVLEKTMAVPLASLAQVRILSESLVEPLPACDSLPDDLLPQTAFTDGQIRSGMPEHRLLGPQDCLCVSRLSRRWRHVTAAR